ncbi:MAG: hypothetical protein ACE5FI_03695, partial [Anaerolineales bacterium]
EAKTPDWMEKSEQDDAPAWAPPVLSEADAAAPEAAGADEDDTPEWLRPLHGEPEEAAEPAALPWDVPAPAEEEPAAEAAAGELPWKLPVPSDDLPWDTPADEDEDDDDWLDVPPARLDFGAASDDDSIEASDVAPELEPAAADLPTESDAGADVEEAESEPVTSIDALRERSREALPSAERRGQVGRTIRRVVLSLLLLGLLAAALAFAAIQFEYVPPPRALAGVLPMPGLLRGPTAAPTATAGPSPTATLPPTVTATNPALLFPTLPPEWTPTNTATVTNTPTHTPTPSITPSPTQPQTPPAGSIVFVRHSAGDDLESADTVANMYAFEPPINPEQPPLTADAAQPLTVDETGQNLSPSGTVSSSSIVWSADAGDGAEIVSVMLADALADPTANRSNLSDNAAIDLQPALSPDGSQIAFVSDRDNEVGAFQLYVMNVDGADVRALTEGESDNFEPSWSPTGDEIVFASDRNGNFDIFVVAVDGSSLEQVTLDPADDRQPAFSPNGDRIAFVSDRDGNSEIYLMEPDGREPVNMTFDDAVDIDPAWAPDGESLVFSTDRDGNFELYLLSIAEVTFHRLTDTPKFDERMPVWLPLAR